MNQCSYAVQEYCLPNSTWDAQSSNLDTAISGVIDIKVDGDGPLLCLAFVSAQVGHWGLDIAQVQLYHLKEVAKAAAAILTRPLKFALYGRFNPALDCVLDELGEAGI